VNARRLLPEVFMGSLARRVATVLYVAALATGCGGSSPTTPTPAQTITYENVAGTWTGTFSAGSGTQPATLTGTLTLNLQQNNAGLTGSYTLMGTRRDADGDEHSAQGTVTLTGTVASGANPNVTFTARSTACANRTADWSGQYVGASGTLTITGTIHLIQVPGCTDLDRFPASILLRR
jgi:hypothetical protein